MLGRMPQSSVTAFRGHSRTLAQPTSTPLDLEAASLKLLLRSLSSGLPRASALGVPDIPLAGARLASK